MTVVYYLKERSLTNTTQIGFNNSTSTYGIGNNNSTKSSNYSYTNSNSSSNSLRNIAFLLFLFPFFMVCCFCFRGSSKKSTKTVKKISSRHTVLVMPVLIQPPTSPPPLPLPLPLPPPPLLLSVNVAFVSNTSNVAGLITVGNRGNRNDTLTCLLCLTGYTGFHSCPIRNRQPSTAATVSAFGAGADLGAGANAVVNNVGDDTNEALPRYEPPARPPPAYTR
ncbi:predicted protein [Lodderomyces elongisporus NRRL YB-4239]|uniref:Uncharacterized protein n=1 Tax=Lodderomyces elongisporus (strain ATCC 11503 / CBS 2605 / JCM 1781 / NBRC 1676 / NRRL YB-4239) TaxID=379508 RepID=A5E719_LODEL|nr:predicted protein [Lodderomyces elongisporus NRRL YB-4239]